MLSGHTTCRAGGQSRGGAPERTAEDCDESDLTSLNWLPGLSLSTLPAPPTPPESPPPQMSPCVTSLNMPRSRRNRPARKESRFPANFDFSVSDQKPPYSYATLIAMAMKACNNKMTLSSIYTWIRDNFQHYRNAEPSWQNSIRHNLSLNKCFIKVARDKNEPGKGGFWRMNMEDITFTSRTPTTKTSSTASGVSRASNSLRRRVCTKSSASRHSSSISCSGELVAHPEKTGFTGPPSEALDTSCGPVSNSWLIASCEDQIDTVLPSLCSSSLLTSANDPFNDISLLQFRHESAEDDRRLFDVADSPDSLTSSMDIYASNPNPNADPNHVHNPLPPLYTLDTLSPMPLDPLNSLQTLNGFCSDSTNSNWELNRALSMLDPNLDLDTFINLENMV